VEFLGGLATGLLWSKQASCVATHFDYQCPDYSRYVQVHLSTIRLHAGIHPYYSRMDVESYYGGAWRWETGWFNGYWGSFYPHYPVFY